jgi:hypothetical protein
MAGDVLTGTTSSPYDALTKITQLGWATDQPKPSAPAPPAPKLPPESGTIVLYPSRGNSVVVLVTNVTRSGGVGGWQTSPRPGQRPGRWFDSPPVDVMGIDGMLDLYECAGPSDIEHRIADLYGMGMRGTAEEPPTITLRGDIRPGDRTRIWVLQDIALGERYYRAPGVLRYQTLTLSLEGYASMPLVAKASIKRTRANGAAAPRTRYIRTVKGDNLRTIAVKQLGSSNQYVQLRQWNPKFAKTDPDQPLKAGLLVVLH